MKQHHFTLDELRLIRDVVDTASDCEAYTLCRMQEMRDSAKEKACGERLEKLCGLLTKIENVIFTKQKTRSNL